MMWQEKGLWRTVWDILREFVGHNFVSGHIKTFKKLWKTLKTYKK